LEDKSEYQAKVIGSDEDTDLAVIKIDVGRDLAVAKLGNSDAVKVGDWVLAIGSPFTLDHTVTHGIISAKGRDQLPGEAQTKGFQPFLQTDAAINPGNSGGPLVNMAGEVIGINTAIISETRQSAGLGFALPSNVAVKVYNQLVQGGKVTRGGIGIQYTSNQEAKDCRALGLQPQCGVIVQSVQAGGPAAKAGLRALDVITEIDGVKTPNGSALLNVVADSAIGKTIHVKINRDGKEMTIPITIVDRQEILSSSTNAGGGPENSNEQGEATQAKLGIRVQAITSDMARRLRLSSPDGVYVSAVEQDSVAEDAGIVRGTIITRIIAGNQRLDVRNVEDFKRAEMVLKSGMDVGFQIMQPDANGAYRSTGFVAVTIP
jgi:serine protease Do